LISAVVHATWNSCPPPITPNPRALFMRPGPRRTPVPIRNEERARPVDQDGLPRCGARGNAPPARIFPPSATHEAWTPSFRAARGGASPASTCRCPRTKSTLISNGRAPVVRCQPMMRVWRMGTSAIRFHHRPPGNPITPVNYIRQDIVERDARFGLPGEPWWTIGNPITPVIYMHQDTDRRVSPCPVRDAQTPPPRS
jgi:hypothetical protein